MIRTLNEEELICFSKLRLNHPYKLLWQWLFGVTNIIEDFDYIFGVEDANWRVIGVKIIFMIPIYLIVGIYKVVEFCLIPFDLEDVAGECFEAIGFVFIISIFGTFRLPYAIYTYMRFNRATALINMLKSS